MYVKKVFFVLLFFFFSSSCKEASFTVQNGLEDFTFDSKITADHTMNFEIQKSNEVLGDTLAKASLNNGVIFEHASSLADDDEASVIADFSFQNYVVAYKTEGESSNSLNILIAPYLSSKVILNTVATALYLKIRNSIPYAEFKDLSISNSTWLELLRDYENFCISCLNKPLIENLEMLNQNSSLWESVKSKINSSLEWEHKPLTAWSWVLIETNPKIYFTKKITLKEGSNHKFTASLFHPSSPKVVYHPTSWSHDFIELDTLISHPGDALEEVATYDNDNNAEYHMKFSRTSEGLPDVTYETLVTFDNTNRSAILSTSSLLPNIVLSAGQELTVDLTQYFSDPDNPSEVLTLSLLDENDAFKLSVAKDLLIYGPGTHFYLGVNQVPFIITDNEGLDSETFYLNVTINPNSPPTISHIYKNNNPSVKYLDGDTISFDEGALNQSFTIVSTDANNDRTIVNLRDEEVIKSNFSYDPGRTFGIVEPRSSSWRFDYDKSTHFTFTPGSSESTTKFEIRPSYYQSNNISQKSYNLRFKVLSSSSAILEDGVYKYVEIPLTASKKDEFSIKIKVINKDDAPVYPGSQKTAPSVNETVPFNIDLTSLINFTDRTKSASTVSLVYTSKSCSWISYSSNTLTGTPPLDSPSECSVNFYLKDSATSFHGAALAPANLRTSGFSVKIPVINSNHPPHTKNGVSTNLGTVFESDVNTFNISLLDTTPGNTNFDGHFADLDYDLTDPANPFIDPLESFEFSCSISIAGENNYSECNDSGLIFTPNGNEFAVLRATHSLIYSKTSEDFNVRIDFKDRESTNTVHKIFQLKVINKAAPLIVSFLKSSVRLGEGDLFIADLRVQRFSDAPVDIYPFEIYSNCFGCPGMITSASYLNFSSAADESQSTFIISNLLQTNYSHGDGDGNIESYLVSAQAQSLNASYDAGSTTLVPQVVSSGAMALEVFHVNRAPASISINNNAVDSKFIYDVNKGTKVNALEELPVSVVDPDIQDLIFSSSTSGLSGDVVKFENNKIVIDYKNCPIGGRNLVKNFTINGQDPSGLTKSRNVSITIRNVDTFAGTCN